MGVPILMVKLAMGDNY